MQCNTLFYLIEKGGNDYEIFEHERTTSRKVENPEATVAFINEIWGPF
jgi:hypothetical protein